MKSKQVQQIDTTKKSKWTIIPLQLLDKTI